MKMTEFTSGLFDGKAVARTLLRETRARSQYFDADLLTDPVWELLLTLYDAEESKRVCATKDLRRNSTMSADTLQRWIKVLERRGLLTTIADSGMLNEGLVKLTGPAHRAMESYLMDVAQLDPERF
jgi:DNA-binding MarR family transcriptional regulator